MEDRKVCEKCGQPLDMKTDNDSLRLRLESIRNELRQLERTLNNLVSSIAAEIDPY